MKTLRTITAWKLFILNLISEIPKFPSRDRCNSVAICTHTCKAPDPDDIEDECFVTKNEFSHCEDCKSCDSGHGILAEEEIEFAANTKSLKTYLGSTRQEKLKSKSAKLSFKIRVAHDLSRL